jgi:hypothetical protein
MKNQKKVRICFLDYLTAGIHTKSNQKQDDREWRVSQNFEGGSHDLCKEGVSEPRASDIFSSNHRTFSVTVIMYGKIVTSW